MFNIIIVDDDKKIRMGLKTYFEEDLKSFFVIADFDNAEDAIVFLNKNFDKTDIVLTDIRLPQDTGISIAKHIFEKKWNIITVLISGYKEFSYAKQAFKYNVYDYLEKPIDFDELDSLFENLEDELKRKNADSYFLNDKESETLRFVGFLTAAYTGLFSDCNHMKNQLERFGLSSELISQKCCKISLKCRMSEEDVYNKYGQIGTDNVLTNCFMNPYVEFYNMYEKKDYREIIAVSKNDNEDISFERFVNSVLSDAQKELQKLGFVFEIISTEFFDDICAMNNSAQITEENQNIIRENMQLVLDESQDGNEKHEMLDGHIRKALQFIKSNYKNAISIGEVAEYVMLSPSYFSRAFKLNIGKSFTDYLLDLRMEKAKELLLFTVLNVSEVSREVGYSDVNYFIRLFKKRVGSTPSRYKNRGGEV